jgi:membrane dipeptidase
MFIVAGRVCRISLALALTLVGCSSRSSTASPEGAKGEPSSPEKLDPDALHREAIVIDTHNDITPHITEDPKFDFLRRNDRHHTDIVRMHEGGVDAEFLAAYAFTPAFPGEKAWPRTLDMIRTVHDTVDKSQGQLVLARSGADIRRAHAQGKMALLIGVEGGHSLGDFSDPEATLDRIRELRRLGTSYITITHASSNGLAGSSSDDGRDRGLSPLGKRAIRLMNEIGMLIDVSHVSDPTFFDIIELSTRPIIATHSSARALGSHARNMTNDMLEAMAENDGVVCINFWPGFLSDEWAKRADEQYEQHKEQLDAINDSHAGDELEIFRRRWEYSEEIKKELEPVPLATLMAHFEHVIDVAGIDHVGIGSDFDGVTALPESIEDVSSLPVITRELVARGHTREEVEKVLGLNVLRVMDAQADKMER